MEYSYSAQFNDAVKQGGSAVTFQPADGRKKPTLLTYNFDICTYHLESFQEEFRLQTLRCRLPPGRPCLDRTSRTTHRVPTSVRDMTMFQPAARPFIKISASASI